MKFKQTLASCSLATALVLAGCSGDIEIIEGDEIVEVVEPTPGPDPVKNCPSFATELSAIGSFSQVCQISGVFTEDATLTNDTLWVLSGKVNVGNDNADSAVLTVQAGTTIIGRSGDDFLAVSRGSQIEALGTKAQPITMTSFEDVAGEETGIGQWGGLVLLGNAPSNLCDGNGDNVTSDAELASCGISAEGNAGLYGGNNPTDNSGTLRYVVVKHAGNALGSGDELNGISFAGVGSDTTVEYIQVYENLDDGIEFFGGTVNVKYVALVDNGDDSFDWSFGWTGKAQFVYVQHSDTFANRGFEADNSEDFPLATPLTSPTVSNVTVVGSSFEDSEGVLLRNGTAGTLRNFLITGPVGMGECLEVDGDEAQANAASGALVMTHSVVACENGENFKSNVSETQTVEQWFLAQNGNKAYDGAAKLNLSIEGYLPQAGSELLGAGYDASQDDSFFESTTFIGAFGAENWMEGWTVGVRGGFPANIQNAFQKGLATDISSNFPAITDKPVYLLGENTTFVEDVTLTNDAHWVLNGRTAVGNDNADSATLYIEQGTTIFGQTGDDFLVARRGSKIQALGTQAAPITMTSVQDVTGQETGIGQWGGLVLLGNAPSNLCDGNGDNVADDVELANCGIPAEGDAGVYGGNNPEDNSGTLRYLVVKYAGKALGSGDELNGISFAGVGSATTVEYIQVHKNLDDGVEFFGGNVNVRYVVLTGNADDSFDWSFGWNGKAQFVYVQQDAAAANRGFELDNNEDFPLATPLTAPRVSNVTIIGANNEDSEGVLLRNGTAGELYNFFITGPAGMGECLEIAGDESRANAVAGTIIMKNSIVACENGENFKGSIDGSQTVEAWFAGQDGNKSFANVEAVKLLADGFQPQSGSELLGQGLNMAKNDSFEDAWFKQTDFIGAFDGETNWMEGWTVGINSGIPSTVKSADELGLATLSSAFPAITDKPVYLLNATTTFTEDTVLTNDKHWVLNGRTAVGNDRADSATLYIEPGTVIFGQSGDDFLVVRRGSKIEALGSASAPITMTSVQDVTGQPTAIGQWGGLVLLGNAPSNLCDGNGDNQSTVEELANCGIPAEGDAGVYGGDNPLDNSGTLRYVVVKFAGKALGSGDELNGISFAGVGSGTLVDYIQVHMNLDDGVEFFGGNVNVRHVVLTGNADDSFDWSFGWNGKAQYVYVKHNDTAANRGFELDNNEDAPLALPLTAPTVGNITIVGSNFVDSEGILLRNGTAGSLHNIIVTGPAGMGECLEIAGDESKSNATNALVMTHSVLACENGENTKGEVTGALTVEAWFLGQDGNQILGGQADVLDGYKTKADLTATPLDMNTLDAWFDSTDFVGAVGERDWTAGWTVGL